MARVSGRRIVTGDGDPRHGTLGGYTNHRCRCDLCVAESRRYNRERDRERRAALEPPPPGDPRHGQERTFNDGCRCDLCRAAAAAGRRARPAAVRRSVTPGDGDKTHGTYAGYAHGCRCGPCKDAQVAYREARRGLVQAPAHARLAAEQARLALAQDRARAERVQKRRAPRTDGREGGGER